MSIDCVVFFPVGRSQGFAFAEFQTREDAQNCVSYFEMAGQILGCQSGGQLRVGDKRIKVCLELNSSEKIISFLVS